MKAKKIILIIIALAIITHFIPSAAITGATLSQVVMAPT